MTLLDAGPLVAMLDRREQHHPWATARLREVRKPLVTCEAVLSESWVVAQFEKTPVILNGVSPRAKAGAKRSEESLTLMGGGGLVKCVR